MYISLMSDLDNTFSLLRPSCFVCAALALLVGCSGTTTPRGEDIRTGFGTNVAGFAIRQNGTPLAGVVIEVRAYSNVCVPANFANIKGATTDRLGRVQFDIQTGIADSLCLNVSATPPAGSGLAAITHAGVIVQKNPSFNYTLSEMSFDSVKVNFVFP
jgi:hypothetical protein